MSKYVLDASAVPALLSKEMGMKKAERLLAESIISTVNVTEVMTNLIDGGMPLTSGQ